MTHKRRGVPQLTVAALVLALLALGGCTSDASTSPASAQLPSPSGSHHTSPSPPTNTTPPPTSPQKVAPQFANPLPGMPPVINGDIYAADGAGMVSPAISHDPAYLYVPNSYGAPHTTIINERTHRIVRVVPTGSLSQHVTPSWDLSTLYVEASESNRLTVINPRDGRIEGRVAVPRPYNLYFTPNGKAAVVMSEQYDQIIFTDPHTFARQAVVKDPTCRGPNHADFSANGRFFVVTCEFSGSLLKISTVTHRVIGRLALGPGSQPQDIRLSPDGRTFYVADMGRNRLDRVTWNTLRLVGYTVMPDMPHGIYPSRDGKDLYVSDRGAGEVSVVSIATNKIVETWTIPGGGSPDMGGVSADGKVLWLSGRNDGEVYGWNTTTGRLIARIDVGGSPHGILVWPQPGRYSLGHTGNMR